MQDSKTHRANTAREAVRMMIEAGPEGVRCWRLGIGTWTHDEWNNACRDEQLPEGMMGLPLRRLRPEAKAPTVYWAFLRPGTPAFREAIPDLLDWLENGSAGWNDEPLRRVQARTRAALSAHFALENYTALLGEGE